MKRLLFTLAAMAALAAVAHAQAPLVDLSALDPNAPTLTGLTAALSNCRAQFSSPKCDLTAARCSYTISDCATVEAKWVAAGGQPAAAPAAPDAQAIIHRQVQ